jgi:hypothetical protein
MGLEELRTPTFCPNCKGLMRGKSTYTYYDYGVCQLCFVEFIADGREEKWKNGWRPSEDEMKKFQSKYFPPL